MNDPYLRPAKIVGTYGRLYPEAWKQVDEHRARRKEIGNWPDWCFLPLAMAYAIVSRSRVLQSPNQAHHTAILGALAGWRVTQGIYGFDPATFAAVSKTPVVGDIPAEVLLRLPEWCVYILTPGETWQGAALSGFFAHLDHDAKARRMELRLLLDLTGAAGDQLEAITIPLGKDGVAASVEAMKREADRQFPVTLYTDNGACERLASDVSPLVSLVLYLCCHGAEIREAGGGKRAPARPEPQKTKKGMRLFPPEHPSRWEVGNRLGAALRQARSEHESAESGGSNISSHSDAPRARWHSFRSVAAPQADVSSVTLQWLPPNALDERVVTI